MTLVVMGVCGSGKSHIGAQLAARLGCVFDDADDLHLPANYAKLAAGIPLTDDDRQPWYVLLRQRIVERRQQQPIHVLACSALTSTLRAWLREDDCEGKISFILLNGPRELIASRMNSRQGHFMPVSLLDNQLATLEVTPELIEISIDGSPEEIVDSILARLGISLGPETPG